MNREDFDKKYTERLSVQQKEAVHATEGAVLLLAVPGSGKTAVLVTRLGYMICCLGIPSEKILTMTYTRAATLEMSRRFSRLFGDDCGRIPEFRTINGVSSKIIDYYAKCHSGKGAFRLVEDEGWLSKTVGGIYRELCGEFPTQSVIKELRKNITYVKNSMLDKDEIDTLETDFAQFPELYRRYNALLRQKQLMDYDDQMIYAKTILEKYPDVLARFQNTFEYICVDESQDTSKIQHAIIHLLAQKSGNIFMVGDEDQSIYGFRAAYPKALVDFEKTYPGARVLLMEENYRSTPEILRLADDFIEKNRDRRKKNIRPTRPAGADVKLITVADRAAQYKWLAHEAAQGSGDKAVLYRNNDSALPLIDLLERKGISYRCRQTDDTFFTHKTVADILDIIAFANDTENADSFMRIYYKIGGGISKTAAEYACEKSKSSKISILKELLYFPQLSLYAKESVIELQTQLPRILNDSAVCGLKRIWNELHYGDYIKQQKQDENKFEILCLLAEYVPSLNELPARLDELRAIVTNPPESPNSALILSTVHSAKGLEYDSVYVTDVLDGILPAVTYPASDDEQREYEEERRLFYVALTRAKNNLFLFSCINRPSEFVDEVIWNIPAEVTEKDDVFSALSENICKKRYHHSENGRGTVIGFCDGLCLVEYESKTELLSLGQMYDRRRIVRKLPEKPQYAAEKHKATNLKTQNACEHKLTPEEKRELVKTATAGQRVEHKNFGAGVILSFSDPIVTIRFSKFGEKKFVLSDSVERGLLRFI